MKNRKWCVIVIGLTMLWLILAAGIIVVVDPFFQYHGPIAGLQYQINNERYQNDGIVEFFDYDAVITGTSMTENFKTSEFDRLFQVTSVKVPFSGASYKEINDNLEKAFFEKQEIRCVLRGLDHNRITDEKDKEYYDYDLDYLYNRFLPDDVSYVWNKQVLLDNVFNNVLMYTIHGNQTTTFDQYENWDDRFSYGKESVLKQYERPDKNTEKMELTQEDQKNITENIGQNVLAVAAEHPETEFYLFYTPYSIVYWDSLNQMNGIERQIQAEKMATEQLLKYDNVHVFSMFDEYEMICNLDNYKDAGHYREEINSQLLEWISRGEHQLTKDNYQEYYNEIMDFYTNYQYEVLFE